MPDTRPWTALALLLATVLAAQPAAAMSGYYSTPGSCGGTAPIAVACTSQHKDLPPNVNSLNAIAGFAPHCVATPCVVGAVRLDFQITGFRPTSYDPAYSSIGHCVLTDSAVDCAWDSYSWSFRGGDDVVITGQVSRVVCPDRCTEALPPVGDWCVGVMVNGGYECRLDGPVVGVPEVPTIKVQHAGPLP